MVFSSFALPAASRSPFVAGLSGSQIVRKIHPQVSLLKWRVTPSGLDPERVCDPVGSGQAERPSPRGDRHAIPFPRGLRVPGATQKPHRFIFCENCAPNTDSAVTNTFFCFLLSGAGSSPHEDLTLLQLRPAGDRVLPGPQTPPRQQGVRGRGPGPSRDQPGPESRPQLHRHHRAVGRPGHLHRENTKLTTGTTSSGGGAGVLARDLSSEKRPRQETKQIYHSSS